MHYKIKKYVDKVFPNFSRKVFYKANSIRYRGDKYFCPICEKGFSKFLTGPDITRKYLKCPGCGSLERQRLLWLYLVNKLEIKNQKINLLNIAPDYATQTALQRLKNIYYYSVDLNSPLAIKKNDITNLEFKDNYFDAIICYHVLEHVENDRKALSEMLRVLKPNGWAILQSPIEIDRATTFEDHTITKPQERKRIFGQEDHVRIYGRDYTTRLEESGFVVKEDDFINNLTQFEKEKYLLNSSEVIYFCTKGGFPKN
ncbi:MAG: methyltransferase domain-containing protein [Ignavibacteria bacterium]|nr:methyltransferase domain-containing protein [Ignavibacteria bacterium]